MSVPLTKYELDQIGNRMEDFRSDHSDMTALWAEVHRLRSEEWLEKAIEEIAASWVPRATIYGAAPNKLEARIQELRAVLHKYRGKP